VEAQNDGDTELRRVLVPAINNLFFVRSIVQGFACFGRRE
jgi:hypothetical protein